MANIAHMGNKKQSMEKEVKDLYLRFTVGNPTAATATLNLTADIILTSVATGTARNTTTFTTQVAAAAANPTDTVLVAFTGTAAAITCTVTPNDGTNNSATPVDLTTAELVELINTGAVVGKTVTLTDASSLRALQTATGGDATDMADAGEGDNVAATFTGGDGNTTSIDSGYGVGFTSVERTDVGEYTITLQDNYPSLKHLRGTILSSTAVDGRVQIKSQSVNTGSLVIYTLTGGTATDLTDGTKVILQMDLKNTNQPY